MGNIDKWNKPCVEDEATKDISFLHTCQFSVLHLDCGSSSMSTFIELHPINECILLYISYIPCPPEETKVLPGTSSCPARSAPAATGFHFLLPCPEWRWIIALQHPSSSFKHQPRMNPRKLSLQGTFLNCSLSLQIYPPSLPWRAVNCSHLEKRPSQDRRLNCNVVTDLEGILIDRLILICSTSSKPGPI